MKKPYSFKWIGLCAAVTILQYLAVRLGLVMGIAHGNVSPVWPATGLAIAILLRYGVNLWPGVFAGSFLGLVQTGVVIPVVVGEALAALLEAITAVWLVRRWTGADDLFSKTRHVISFCLLAGGASTAVSAIIGVCSLYFGGYLEGKSLAYLWGTWWLGDIMGALIVAPFLLIWSRPGEWSADRAVWIRTGLVFTLLILAGLFAFWGPFVSSSKVSAYPVAFLTLPMVVSATFLGGRRGATAACIICSAMAISGTAQGLGPFFRGSVNESLLLLQSYLVVVSVTATILAAVLSERDRALVELQRSREDLDNRIAERTQELLVANTRLQQEVAERTRAEEALQESEAKYRFLAEHGNDILWTVDVNLRTTYVSPSIERVLGFTPGERMRQAVEDQLTPESLKMAQQWLLAALERERRQGNLKDQSIVLELEYLHKDGSVVCLESVLKFIRDHEGTPVGVHGLSRDVTQRKKAEEALRKSEEFNRRLVEHAPFGIVYLGGDGIIEYANPAANRIVGIPEGRKSSTLGQTIFELKGLQDRSAIKRMFGRLLEGEFITDLELPYRSTMGRDTLLLVAAAPRIGSNGSAVGAIVMFMDISERKRAEELQRQTARFRAVADLAGGVAHNFNNLLQVVIGHLELALVDLEAGDLATVKDGLEKVLQRSSFGAEVVRRLQRFAYQGTGVHESDKGVFELSDVAMQAVDVSQALLIASEMDGRKVSIHTRLEGGCHIKADKNEIFSVVLNMLRNAMEALPEGGDIHLTTVTEGDKGVLRVSDTGMGISRENLGRVFNPFFTTKADPGAGLSLASDRKVVEECGGKIFVDSEEGKGTTFRVQFPLAESLPEPTEALPQPGTEPRLTILAIDDTEGITDFLKTALHTHGHTVLTAASGEEGIEIFKQKHADLVICDLGMPGMTGWEVGTRVSAICQERGVSKTPFILLTAWANQELESEKIARSGADAVVAKPLDMKAMLKVIREVCEKTRTRDSN